MAGGYSIRRFMSEAVQLLNEPMPLEELKKALGVRLVDLSERDDLTSHGAIIGPSDASFNSYLLWREPPHLTLVIAQFEPGYRSPIHEHGDHWVVGAGYRGRERWDVYERLDGRTTSGPASIALVEQTVVEPGTWTALRPRPASIHSHNNLVDTFTSELIFSAEKPIPREERMLFDVDSQTCRSSWFGAAEHLVGEQYPPI